jgi:hypothetical protein
MFGDAGKNLKYRVPQPQYWGTQKIERRNQREIPLMSTQNKRGEPKLPPLGC